ncbi:hypothetical protein GCM10010304_80250 [Streptomyces roseoviolaceus]
MAARPGWGVKSGCAGREVTTSYVRCPCRAEYGTNAFPRGAALFGAGHHVGREALGKDLKAHHLFERC